MSSEIRCVIVGYGSAYRWGHRHAQWVEETDGLSLYGICDTDETARRNAEKDFAGRIRLFSDLGEALKDEAVDMVILLTPHDTHAPLAIQALKAGKHVLTEKVMCLNTAEADAMIQAATESGKMLTVFHNRRWDSDFLTVKKVVESGMLGEVFLVESAVSFYTEPSGWRAMKKHGGGQLYDWGAHLLDQAIQLIPAEPATVFADVQRRVWDVDVDTFAKVIVRLANGCLFEVDLCNVQCLSKPRWRVFGDKGTLVKETFDADEKARLRTFVKSIAFDEEIESVPRDWGEIYRNVSAHLNGGAELAVKPEGVWKSIAIIEAAFQSAESGQSVSLKNG